jgi:uncharacterized protein (DUF2225 family)
MESLENPDKKIQCPLCGFRFTKGSAKACSGCPLGRGNCQRVVCCPNCGYGFVESSAILDWIRKLLRRRKRDETPT